MSEPEIDRCVACLEPKNAATHVAELNIRGMGMWKWKLCMTHAIALRDNALSVTMTPVPDVNDPGPTTVVSGDLPSAVCQRCGRGFAVSTGVHAGDQQQVLFCSTCRKHPNAPITR